MSEKNEALRQQEAAHIYRLREEIMQQEIEMQRLHAEVERLTLNGIHTCHAECQRPVCRLTRERNALLEALQSIADCCDEEHAARDYASRQTEIRGIARAAIKAVEEKA